MTHRSHMLTLLLSQRGNTALMLACENKHEAAAGELMEATKRAGALDRQAHDDFPLYNNSALHRASAQGLAGTVLKLLALGADATLTNGRGGEGTDEDGNTALELAKDTATFECLRAAGANMPDITD